MYRINTKINSASQLQVLLRKDKLKEVWPQISRSSGQGHVNYFSIFGFYDLNLVENDTNLITLSHLASKVTLD